MSDNYVFPGFRKPTFTQVPDEVLDELMPRLSGSEFKVLMYIVRRTFGFKKDADAISLTQMTDGIRTRDGRQLDRGCGLARSTAVAAINSLIAKGVIAAEKNQSDERGFEATTYTLHWADDPYAENRTSPVRKSNQPLDRESNPQHTDDQQTEGNSSKSPHPQMLVSREQRSVIEAYARDYATELRDESRIGSTVTRLTRIFANSGLELGSFLDMLQNARQATQKHSASIRKETADGRKSKMSYFLAVVEDLVEKRGA